MEQRKGLLTIGAFASEARLSIKALRLYDQLRILSPRFTDRLNGYRYYHADQLHKARLIRAMREREMPLALIRQVLAAAPAKGPRKGIEAERLAVAYLLMREKRLEQARKLLPELTQLLRQEANMSLQVNVKTLEPQHVLSVTRRVKVDQLDEVIVESVNRLNEVARDQGATAGGAAFGIYHGTINEEDDGPIEICLPVTAKLAASGEITCHKLTGGKAAAVMLHGQQCSFPEVLKGYDAAIDWIKQNGYKPAQSPREVWLAEGPDMQLEVVWPFK